MVICCYRAGFIVSSVTLFEWCRQTQQPLEPANAFCHHLSGYNNYLYGRYFPSPGLLNVSNLIQNDYY